MSTALLTWNPDRFDFGEETYAAHVEATRAGSSVPMAWGTGQNRNRIRTGDAVFLLRQGSRGRVLVASGVATSDIERDPRFDPSARGGNYVEVAWTVVLPLADLLPTAELMERVPAVPWRYLFASGFVVPDGAGLHGVWEEHLQDVGWP